jgi:Tfp pilus assembly protein PilW
MKLFVAHPDRIRLRVRRSQGINLIEVMISSYLMAVIILLGLFAVHLMGLREMRLLESKAGASDSARQNITQLKKDIYGAKGWQIGTWDGSTFTEITNGVDQQGNALIIYPLIIESNQVVDTTKYLLYYFDASEVANFNGRLWYLNSTSGVNQISISNLVPPLHFTAENYQGQTQSVRTYKSVIHATFQYSQFQYPLTQVSSNSIFDNYRIDVRATPHLPDGP